MFVVISHIMRKELIQTFRDPRMMTLLLVAPLLQVTLFGFAVNLDLTAQPLVIADMDRTRASRQAVQAISENDSFSVVGQVDTHEQAEAAIANGEASLALLIPRGYEDKLDKSQAELLIVLDGSDSNTALRAGQEASQILNNRAIRGQIQKIRDALAAQGLSADVLLPRLTIEARAWFNPSMKTAIFLVPGVLALVLMVVTTIFNRHGADARERDGHPRAGYGHAD